MARGREVLTAAGRVLRERSAQVAIVAWIAGVAFVALSVRTLPFDWPGMADMSTGYQLGSAHVQIVWVFLLIAVTLFVTRRRPTIDLAARAPASAINRVELLGLVGYGVAAQVAGYGLGRVLGSYPISAHLPGTVFGITTDVSASDAYVWTAYNFVVYAVIPYLVFRARGYSNAALSLKSADLRQDALLIGVILVLESAFELTFVPNIFSLSSRQLLAGMPLTLVIYFLGTSLPVMVFIYAILLPRYLRLTGSRTTTVILGGLTYAVVHWFEAWMLWNSLQNSLLSIIFLMFQYFGPGMVKSVLTLRTGNAWVHVSAYHSLSPHVWLDTPLIVKIFGIR
jgi:hypothetical protein